MLILTWHICYFHPTESLPWHFTKTSKNHSSDYKPWSAPWRDDKTSPGHGKQVKPETHWGRRAEGGVKWFPFLLAAHCKQEPQERNHLSEPQKSILVLPVQLFTWLCLLSALLPLRVQKAASKTLFSPLWSQEQAAEQMLRF